MTLVLDAQPLLAWFLDEPPAERVEAILMRSAEGREAAAASRVTLAEVAFHLQRKNPDRALPSLREVLERGLAAVPCEPAWERAATIKARHATISLADAFAAATAASLRGELVVSGDDALQRACVAEGVKVRRV